MPPKRCFAGLGIYDGSVNMAGKAAGHELKSLSALFGTGVPMVRRLPPIPFRTRIATCYPYHQVEAP